MKTDFKYFLTGLLILVLAQFVMAAKPRVYSYNSQSDFERGTYKGISILHPGKITISPAMQMIAETGDPYIWDMACDSKGNVYAATGNDGKLYRYTANGDSSLFFDAPELEIYAVCLDKNDRVFAGTSPNGKVYSIDKAGNSKVIFDPDEIYIWDLLIDNNNQLYVTTGQAGNIYKIDKSGKAQIVLKSGQSHIRCLAVDEKNVLYAGTAGNGFVYKIDSLNDPYVLFDTQMQEVHSLVVSEKENYLYAAAFGESSQLMPDILKPQKSKSSKDNGTDKGDKDVALAPQAIILDDFARSVKVPTALFRIDKDGYARDLWLGQDERIQKLFITPDGLLLCLSEKGRLHQVSSKGQSSVLLKIKEAELTAVCSSSKDRLFIGTSNMGCIYCIGPNPSENAEFESETLDTGVISQWGVLTCEGIFNKNNCRFFTRSGNTEQANETWSDWKTVRMENGDMRIDSPLARFVQWKCELLKSGGAAPVLDKVSISYLQKNLPPEVTDVVVHKPGDYYEMDDSNNKGKGVVYPKPLPSSQNKRGFQSVDWFFQDPNFDGLLFDVYYQRLGDPSWIAFVKKFESNFYSWDTQQLADGQYLIKVVATDSPNNPAGSELSGEHTSQEFVIDNTGPQVKFIEQNDNKATFQITDSWSMIREIYVSINAQDWQLVYPVDGISDSKNEKIEINIDNDVKNIAVKVMDAVDNTTVVHKVFK